jgi:uncharacterized membrane protein
VSLPMWLVVIGVGLLVVAMISIFLDSEWLFLFSTIASTILIITGVILGLMAESQEHETERIACEKAGGYYVVVDEETQLISTGKTTMLTEVDIYGCVK